MSVWFTKKRSAIPWQSLPLFILLFAVVIGIIFRWLGSQWSEPTINSRKDIEGSYRILVCDGPCDLNRTGNVIRQGILVLQNGPLAAEKTELLFKAWRGRPLYPDEPAYRGGAPLGCFSLKYVRKDDDGCFAGITPSDFTVWEENRLSHRIRFLLYRSVDGSYMVEGKLSNGFFQGEGETHHPPWEFPKKQRVIAQKIGAPDLGLCLPENLLAR